jgi:hypothetical protein
MKKKILVLLVVLLLVALTAQVAFADPPGPVEASCNMGASFWLPGTGPGNANGVGPEGRGMYHVHATLPHGESKGGSNMSIVCPA